MKIKLNNKVTIDLPKLIESRLLVQANSGGGKSWAIRRIIEQSFKHVQIIVIDPEGEFGNLREKFDFVYAGKGGDAPVESRSAALLAHRLLELKASAIVDLYELPPQERKRFVRLFCEAMVNAPKELWHDVLIIIDEAHVFAPEKGESEAMGPVIDLATRGRKRGYCVVLATQRLPKLNKDAAAECNNKLIGRASQDIDRKRAAEELGFTTKDQIISLRDLEPGEFYVFGPAISREVQKTTIGDVQVKPAKRGVSRSSVPAPSVTVKKLLAKLADLPQEAAVEAKTVAELKQALTVAKREIQALQLHPAAKEPSAMGVSQWANYGKKYGYWDFFEGQITKKQEDIKREFAKRFYQMLLKTHGDMTKALEHLKMHTLPIVDLDAKPKPTGDGMPLYSKAHTAKDWKIIERGLPKLIKKMQGTRPDVIIMDEVGDVPEAAWSKTMGTGERQVLIAIAQQPDGMTREHVTVQTGYKRSTRDAYIQRLLQKQYVETAGKHVFCSDLGREALGNDYEPLPTGPDLLAYHLKNLPEGEAKILQFLKDFADGRSDGMGVERDHISDATGFKRSTRDAYLQRLAARQLVVVDKQSIRISEHLL